MRGVPGRGELEQGVNEVGGRKDEGANVATLLQATAVPRRATLHLPDLNLQAQELPCPQLPFSFDRERLCRGGVM